jgi:hypothetical protein
LWLLDFDLLFERFLDLLFERLREPQPPQAP